MVKGCGKEKNLPALTAVTPNNIGTPRKGIEGFQSLSTAKQKTRSLGPHREYWSISPNTAMNAAQCTSQKVGSVALQES